MKSNLCIIDNKLIHVNGEEALKESLHKYTSKAGIAPDMPVVIITKSLFERLKFESLCNTCA